MSIHGKTFDKCQADYDRQSPPEYPEYEEDCVDETCGECERCCEAAYESYMEDKAEAQYEEYKARQRGF